MTEFGNKPVSIPGIQRSIHSGPEAIAEGILPYYADDSNKTRYLSFRACGFSSSEAMNLTGVVPRTLMRWRESDEEFRRLDGPDIGELRRSLAAEFLGAEFTRNMRLALLRDYHILSKANKAHLGQGDELSDREEHYLRTIRPMYSAQQLQAMIKAVQGQPGDASINFSQMVVNINKAEGIARSIVGELDSNGWGQEPDD
jgi:hypothetical protein